MMQYVLNILVNFSDYRKCERAPRRCNFDTQNFHKLSSKVSNVISIFSMCIHYQLLRPLSIAVGGLILYSTSCVVGWGGGEEGGGGDVWVVPQYRV
jgi:hypothetical protein